MSEQETFPVGTRVRPRHGSPDCEGEVIEPQNSLLGYGVRWDHGVVEWHRPEHLERVGAPEPPRSPVHTLASGVSPAMFNLRYAESKLEEAMGETDDAAVADWMGDTLAAVREAIRKLGG